jgi:hypothetical protein
LKTVPTLGSVSSPEARAYPVILTHSSFVKLYASDLFNVYCGHDMVSYLVRFVAHLDQNGFGDLTWPMWASGPPNLLTFLDGLIPQTITQDTYRAEQV